ncbi:MAG: hypothetical protein BAJALOKI1v1_440008 [Promethearchaeota archaeon]|nr:MAG: hypothetical protein BAJALOKI1v1_440008 [Candidatus Lokiarchaeota archaeon]
MPELPEVESFRRKIDPQALGSPIIDVVIKEENFLETPKDEFKKSLLNKEFESTRRRGKNIFIKFNMKYLLLHFGMSGDVQFYKNKRKEPKYSKVIFKFKQNTFLSIISIRKFGKVQLIEDYEKFIKKMKIGPDALEITLDEFKTIMEQKKRSFAKTALMDQSALSGIGNLYSDEVLFQSRIFPKTKISALNEGQIEELHINIKDILTRALTSILTHDDYPNDFFIPYRSIDKKCPVCKSKIQRLKISSRHSFYCSTCQSK